MRMVQSRTTWSASQLFVDEEMFHFHLLTRRFVTGAATVKTGVKNLNKSPLSAVKASIKLETDYSIK